MGHTQTDTTTQTPFIQLGPAAGEYSNELHPVGPFTGEIIELNLKEQEFINDRTGKPEMKQQIQWVIQSDTLREDGSNFRLFKRTSTSPHENSGLRAWIMQLGGKALWDEVTGRNGLVAENFVGCRVHGFVAHDPGKRDPSKVYANIAGCALVRDSTAPAAPAAPAPAAKPPQNVRAYEYRANAEAQATRTPDRDPFADGE